MGSAAAASPAAEGAGLRFAVGQAASMVHLHGQGWSATTRSSTVCRLLRIGIYCSCWHQLLYGRGLENSNSACPFKLPAHS